MSEKNEAVDTSCCAACGIAELDDIKLVPCDDCDLVRYCSDECQNNHKSEHEEACRKRAAELRDELLFKQPESSHLGDCPICMLPLPLDIKKYAIYGCCSKVICRGCSHANWIREVEMRLEQSCPFCRKPAPSTDEECDRRRMKRIEVNDPVAMRQEGVDQYNEGDYRTAFDYWSKAAELGDTDAHCKLSAMYYEGKGVEKDVGKGLYHLEEAAIAGHADARYNLGADDWNSRNIERAVKHFIIAAIQGYDESIKTLMRGFKAGFVAKDVLAAALRAHKAAVDATKSPQREAAERYSQM